MQLAMKTSSQANDIPFLSTQVKTELPNSFGSLQSGKTSTSFLDMVNSYEMSSKSESLDTSHTEEKVQTKENVKSESSKDIQKEKPVEKESSTKATEKSKSSEEEKKSKKTNSNEKDENKNSSEKSVSQTENANLQQLSLSHKDGKSTNLKVSVKNKNFSEVKSGKEKDIQAEQLSFLKTREYSDTPDSILANIEEYSSDKSEDDLLENAQNFSLENPKSFLEEIGIAAENQTAANTSTAKMKLSKDGTEIEEKTSSTVSAKKASTKKNNIFTVIDERGSASKDESAKTQKTKLTVSKSSENSNELNLTMTMNKNVEQNILSTSSQTAGAAGSNFQAMLSEQIQQNAPDFVKAGNIVLQDSKSGTINMVLKPESLGNVKISLQLSDKVITGQITVQSQEAYDAFKENIENLKQAFQQSGFESPQFNLSYSNNGNSGNPQQGQQQMANSWLGNQAYGDLASSTDSNQQSDFVPSKKDSIYAIDFVA